VELYYANILKSEGASVLWRIKKNEHVSGT